MNAGVILVSKDSTAQLKNVRLIRLVLTVKITVSVRTVGHAMQPTDSVCVLLVSLVPPVTSHAPLVSMVRTANTIANVIITMAIVIMSLASVGVCQDLQEHSVTSNVQKDITV